MSQAESPVPTRQDRENAATRAAIAARQNAAFDDAQALADSVLGTGFTPWMALRLIDSDYHQTGNCTPVATAFKVCHGEERLTENSVYLRRMPDGTVKRADRYEELFGDLLTEPHPTRKLDLLNGQVVPAPHYSLTWSALERYTPKDAEGLAALRVTRERNKAEKAEKELTEEFPLFKLGGLTTEDMDKKKGRGR